MALKFDGEDLEDGALASIRDASSDMDYMVAFALSSAISSRRGADAAERSADAWTKLAEQMEFICDALKEEINKDGR